MSFLENLVSQFKQNTIDTPDGKQASSTVSYTNKILPKQVDPYADLIFKRKNGRGSNFNLIHNYTIEKDNGGYEICFTDPFTDEEIIVSDKELPLQMDMVSNDGFMDTVAKINKFEGLTDTEGKPVNIQELQSRVQEGLIMDAELLQAMEKIPVKVVEDLPSSSTILDIPRPKEPTSINTFVPQTNSKHFDILNKIKKIDYNLEINLKMPNLEIFSLLKDNLEIDNFDDINDEFVNIIINQNLEDFTKQLKIFVNNKINGQ